jgi:predicted NAD-dependent protein-ADP-ribosyltransferase YbiA (DUF1768 family)
MLSSLYGDEPFIYAGARYRSAEHALQAAKFAACCCDAIARRFSLDSAEELGRAPAIEARRQRKIIMLSGAQLALWDTRRHEAKLNIYLARYAQGQPARALRATGEAELWSAGPRIRRLRATTLEEARRRLRSREHGE